jgi:hypothetical protein
VSAWLIALVGVIYAWVAADLAWRGSWWQALIFFGYAVSNIGLWKLATEGMK